jgi:hypothetical protein
MHSINNCRPPKDAPPDYCSKLKHGLRRLEAGIRAEYERNFPAAGAQIAQTVKEAEAIAWTTPFPSLFFPPLAHLKLNERFVSA